MGSYDHPTDHPSIHPPNQPIFRRYGDGPITGSGTVYRCLSLESRDDRRNHINQLFTQLQIPVKYFLAQPHPAGGKYGCFESHINIWMQHMDLAQDQLLVIFEDDVILNQPLSPKEFQDILGSAQQLLQTYDIVHLDRSIQQIGQPVLSTEKWSFWTGQSVDADLYVISGRTIRLYLDHIMKGWGQHIDQIFRTNLNQVFLYPRLFTQRDIFDSDNRWNSPWADFFLRSGHLIRERAWEPLQFLFQPLLLKTSNLVCSNQDNLYSSAESSKNFDES